MKNKYFYPIYKLKIKSWIKYWLIKQTEFKGVLSDILEGTSFYLTDCLNMKFKIFDIIGRSVQDGDPTPENPVPIKNTGDNGSVNEKVQNKNLFDKNIGILSGKGLNADGTTFNSGTSSVHNYIKVKPSTTYTLSGGTDTSHKKIICMYSEENETSFLNVTSNAGVGITFTTTSTTNYIRIQFKTTELENMQLEQGTISTSYVPHSEQNISLTLPEGMKLCKIGDNADYFYKEDGKWYKHEVIKKIVLTGNENWIYYTNVGEPYFFYTPDYTNIIKNKIVDNSIILCNYFQNRGKAYKPSGQGIFVNADISGKIENGNLSVTTYDWGNNVKTFKQFLREKKPEVYFAVKEPTEIEITDETLIAQLEAMQALRTYKNVTHITSSDETPAELKIQYWKEE